MIQTVLKRDGRIVGFNEEKIVTAIRKAMLHTDKGEDMQLISQITDHISFKGDAQMTVEAIQDLVEMELMKSSRKDVAQKYIAYRNQRSIARKAKTRDMFLEIINIKSMLTDEAARLNNRVLRERPEGLFVAFHAATDMLIRLHGADAYFLNYDCGICDRSRLLWFVHEREAVFGFVLSYYPDEEELDELQAKMEEVLNYIPMKHLTLCLPDADNLLNPSEEDEVKQWKTVRLAKDMANRIFSV